MTQQQSGGGFQVHAAPGAQSAFGGGGEFSPYTAGLPPRPPNMGGQTRQQQKQEHTPAEELAFEEVNTKISSPKRQMTLGLTEKYSGIASNITQVLTTMLGFMQICLDANKGGLGADTTLLVHGPIIGFFQVLRDQTIYVIIGLLIGVGAQLLVQMGCQKISKKWKAEHITQHQDQRFGIVKVALNAGVGTAYTILGFVIDGLSDLSFAYAFHIPWYVCVIFGLIMNGMSTVIYYDGDERFHAAYMIWWRLEMAKRAWAIASQRKAFLMQGITEDGKALIKYQAR